MLPSNIENPLRFPEVNWWKAVVVQIKSSSLLCNFTKKC